MNGPYAVLKWRIGERDYFHLSTFQIVLRDGGEDIRGLDFKTGEAVGLQPNAEDAFVLCMAVAHYRMIDMGDYPRPFCSVKLLDGGGLQTTGAVETPISKAVGHRTTQLPVAC